MRGSLFSKRLAPGLVFACGIAICLCIFAPGHAVAAKPAVSAEKPKHWSFQPLREVALPSVQNKAWEKEALDRLILARLEAAGIAPNPDANRYELLRRVALDLTGLPPSIAQMEAFVKDPAPD